MAVRQNLHIAVILVDGAILLLLFEILQFLHNALPLRLAEQELHSHVRHQLAGILAAAPLRGARRTRRAS